MVNVLKPFKIFYELRRARRNSWKDSKTLEGIRDEKLRKIIKHAYTNVPYYREKFDKVGIKPEDIKTAKDLPKIPITTKKDLAKNYPDKITAKGTNLKDCWITQTSGSTGIPLTVAWDRDAEIIEKAYGLRPNFESGQNLFDKWFIVTSPAHISKKMWFQKLGILNVQYVSLFDDTSQQIRQMNEFKPKIIDGYASSIWLMARKILDKKAKLSFKPKLVYTTSEVLYDHMRKDIKKAFGVEPLDQFGCVEVNRTAWECSEHKGYHLDIDAVVTEFIKKGKNVNFGESGEIVYTSLYNKAMPIIRYKVGDIGIPSNETCSCGRGLPMMKALEGRKDDYVKLKDGRIFSPIIGTILFRDVIGIEQFRFIQETFNDFTLEIVKNEKFNKKTLEEAKENVRKNIDKNINLKFKIVKKIGRSGSGKLRSVISKVGRIE